ncbi:hypothetical protein HYG77_04880 [Rhodococcus sp. ZPP]|uniref:hypothetical protein n=1 Tax=Rhodococcus sp. ZPP TaxID=2749906 RepID=UPI001AD89706|nr:hypothetical protein [Rhodococcus sp. ZPP]QTJ64998.1 hypothetical protein HYG77_04880 [Rhodococcus sp. ZPP]
MSLGIERAREQCDRGIAQAVREIDEIRAENTKLLGIVDRYRRERDAEREKVAALTKELHDYRLEASFDEEWNRRLAVDNVRCQYCDLRYGEREQYGCTDSNSPHSYSEAELRAAREGGAS